MKSLLFFFILLLTQSLGRAAECQLSLVVDHIDWQGGTRGGYNVFESGEYAQTVQFRIRLTGDPCPFFIGISSGDPGENRRAATFGTDRIDYWVYDSISSRVVLKDMPSANEHEVIRGRFAPGETEKELTFVIVVPARQTKGAGRYTDSLRLTAYAGTPQSFVPKDSKVVTFSIPVEETAELSLVQPGSSFEAASKGQNLDFESLTKGKAKGFDMRIRSNAGYQVLLESEHGGVMKSLDPSMRSTIPYTVQIGGQPVNLSKGRQAALARSQRKTDAQGDRHEVLITVGDVANAMAGTYRDNITVTIISDN